MQNNTTKRSHKKLFIILAICTFVIALVGVLLNNVSGSTKPIRAVADQFHAPASWKLTQDDVEPPRFICLNDTACPRVSRSWEVDTLSSQELVSLLTKTEWNYEVEGDCKNFKVFDDENLQNDICFVYATYHAHEIQLVIDRNAENKASVSLFVQNQ